MSPDMFFKKGYTGPKYGFANRSSTEACTYSLSPMT